MLFTVRVEHSVHSVSEGVTVTTSVVVAQGVSDEATLAVTVTSCVTVRVQALAPAMKRAPAIRVLENCIGVGCIYQIGKKAFIYKRRKAQFP